MDVYSHGHHESVLRAHRARTAENSCGYLLPLLRPGLDVLDVGCGPGTITADLAGRVAPGRVVGIDLVEAVLPRAVLPNLAFARGDVYELAFATDSFDVVHAHQMLQHLTRPVDALIEMRRVLKPGGVLGIRDSDYGAFTWGPPDPMLDRWLALYHELTRHNGAEADAGRHLEAWTRAAGFSQLSVSTSTWMFADPDSREWWGSVWAERVLESQFAEQSIAYGLTTRDELQAIAHAWRQWAQQPDGFFAVPHGEVVATK